MKDSTKKLIINALRQATITWEGRKLCLNNARNAVEEGKYKNGKIKYKYYWKCADCKEKFRNETDMEVDHIDQIGSVKEITEGVYDWTHYIPRMFCDHNLKNLQCLCIGCHLKKTTTVFNASKSFTRKK